MPVVIVQNGTVPSGGPIALLQYAFGTTATGNAGLTASFTGALVSGAGTAAVDGILKPYLFVNGRQSYVYEGSTDAESNGVYWGDNNKWNVRCVPDGLVYESSDNVATPDLCTTWIAINDGANPPPTVSSVSTPLS